ncbi:MAG: ABC transporter substrate-binding protein [Hydrogenophaga sp.]|nr:ABC transporter substrate-binding protein [Hydrogenophaga sp.]
MPFETLAFTRRQWMLLTAAASAAPRVVAQTPRPAWSDVEKAARGQTVFFNAWAGSERTNAYLRWVGEQVQAAHGVKLEHVKITDTADVVKRVRAEKAAGRGPGDGTVDLVWINGENFAAMKREGLLFGPFADSLPNFRYVDTVGKPTTLNDFSVPTEGMESPWGMAQFTFFADSRRLATPPQSMAELLALARSQPGRISYPRLPAFVGTTFVKQALVETVADAGVLSRPPVPADFAQVTAPLWQYLDALHPHLWRSGKQFPQNPAAIRQMVADGELLVGLTFNPNEAANEVAAQRLPASTTSWQFAKGTIGNTHFVAIPYNSKASAGAQVVANFLLSPQAQAHKADIAVWGDPTVLALDKLPPAERGRFPSQPLPGQVAKPAPTLPEPHAAWVEPIEQEWTRRYAV